MEHIIPEVPLKVLQGIYRELVAARDPDATFVAPVAVVEPEKTTPGIGES